MLFFMVYSYDGGCSSAVVLGGALGVLIVLLGPVMEVVTTEWAVAATAAAGAVA